jgi:hypothetical protein
MPPKEETDKSQRMKAQYMKKKNKRLWICFFYEGLLDLYCIDNIDGAKKSRIKMVLVVQSVETDRRFRNAYSLHNLTKSI